MDNSSKNKENFDNAKSFITELKDFTSKNNEQIELFNQSIQKTSNILNEIGSIYIESKKIENDNFRLKNELASILSNFKLKQSYLEAVFSERSKIIDKHFEVIDKGLRENNDELIIQGLKGASQFVSTNPIDDFDDFNKILSDNNKPLELDF